MGIFGLFHKLVKDKPEDKGAPKVKRKTRAFKGAQRSRYTEWLFSGFNKINVDTKHDLRELIIRCRRFSEKQ